MTLLQVQNLSYNLAGRDLVQDASLRVEAGDLTAILGPNGAGKTSLIRALLGLEPKIRQASVQFDTCRIGDTNLRDLTATSRARRVSYLPQTRPLAWPSRVRDIVALGRFAYGASLQTMIGTDAEAVDRALTACDLHPLAERRADTLSGGELARVHVARALAADAPLLIADEPVAALDPYAQFQTMDLIRRFVDQGGGALVILHDVALAARYADRLIWMQGGRIMADGPVADTLTEARLNETYGVKSTLTANGPILLGRS